MVTDQTKDLIREAAEFVGWMLPPSGNDLVTYLDGSNFWFPHSNRGHLHALTGLVEDKLREDVKPGRIVIHSGKVCRIDWVSYTEHGFQEIEHKDPLIARLGALMELKRNIDAENKT